ncbi:MAG: hypothetical protein AAFN78_04485 [Pseudomonadota bacterium]
MSPKKRKTSTLVSKGVRSALSARPTVVGAGLLALAVGGATYSPHATAFPAEVDLSSLATGDGTTGFVLNGVDDSDMSGRSVSNAGDVNGDGIDDLIIGAYLADPNVSTKAGESYIVYGTDEGFAPTLELSSLNGTNGFVLEGFGNYDYTGWSVSGAGDINGDGIDDMIIGSPDGGPTVNGAAFVVFGTDQGFPASLGLITLDGGNGFELVGIDNGSNFGGSVGGAGDVNGDGFEDIIVGAYTAGVSQAGETLVVFGTDQGFPNAVDLPSVNGGNGFALSGIDDSDHSGFSVDAAGDVNDDGFGDIIIGAPQATPGGAFSTGEAYVVFGSDQSFPAALDLASLDGSNGFVMNGVDGVDRAGDSVSGAGDVNGDGIDDVIVGARYAGTNGAGESYVVFGSDKGFAAAIELGSLDGSNGFAISGIDSNDRAGYSVSAAGDVNGDGIGDVIVGAWQADPNGTSSGESYVVFGSDQGFPAAIELASLNGSNGFLMKGIDNGDNAGFAVSSAGDINGDGIDDIIVGARGADPNGASFAGETYVVFGGVDTDADGVNDAADNCTDVANPSQRDTNNDGIGNACDADLNNDCAVNFADVGAMKAVFFTTDADADLNGNGTVNFIDLAVLKAAIFLPPGPSGIPTDCNID